MSDTAGTIAIIVGVSAAAISAGFPILYNWRARKREEYLNISHVKMDHMTKFAKYYVRLASYARAISKEFVKDKNDIDKIKSFYYVGKLIETKNIVFSRFGGVRLDNLDAEQLLETFFSKFTEPILSDLGYYEYQRIACLVSENKTFPKLHDLISSINPPQSYTNFIMWLNVSNCLQDMAKYLRWYNELLMLELNHVYKVWYGAEHNICSVSKELQEYLLKDHANYFNRIQSLEARAGRQEQQLPYL